MREENNLNTLEESGRKKFFTKISKGFLGLVILTYFPFNLFGKNLSDKKVEIKINPLAVKREKGNKNNG